MKNYRRFFIKTLFNLGILSLIPFKMNALEYIQDCETTNPSFPNVPFEKVSIPHGNYDVFSYSNLANKIADRTPGDLNHVFFTTCGSTAVDSAIRFVHF